MVCGAKKGRREKEDQTLEVRKKGGEPEIGERQTEKPRGVWWEGRWQKLERVGGSRC